MAVSRKGNPRFHLRENRVGGRSWMLRDDVTSVDVAGLRSGLAQKEQVEVLPKQLSVLHGERAYYHGRNAGYAEHDWVRESHRGGNSFFVGAGGVVFSGVVVAQGALVLGALVAAGSLAAFAVPSVHRFLAERYAKRKERRAYVKQFASPRKYRREARRMAELFPHGGGSVERYESGSKRIVDADGEKYKFASKVDGSGVAEVSWRWDSRKDDGGTGEGTLVFCPYANMEGHFVPFPVVVPNVNLRGANFEGSGLVRGSVLDGADLRDANLREVRWREVSLDGADLRGADVTGARLPDDLTGTNISREQFEVLLASGNSGGERVPYRVREASTAEVVAAFGGDRDVAVTAVWAGDVEVRDRETHSVVSGRFDPTVHYIPHWALDGIRA